MTLLRAVDEINRRRPERVLALLGRHFATLEGVPVTVLGLAFKPDTDDVRHTPAAAVIDLLLDRKARVTVYDPVALPRLRSLYPGGDVIAASSMEEAVREAAAVVLVTRWQEFASLPDVLEKLGLQPLVVDGRRMLDSSAFARYEGIGRG
jgi:UDPglucose 6-dehydrogenase/GDP-mannose 6-dehydrogenase